MASCFNKKDSGGKDDGKTELKVINWNDQNYYEALSLRNELLMKSAGKPFLTSGPLEEKQAVHMVIMADGMVAGTLYLKRKTGAVGQIKQVAVSSQYQGLGLGRQLMSFAEKVARLMGYSLIYLEGREDAWEFYKRLDYQVVSHCYQDGQLRFLHFEKKVTPRVILPERKLSYAG